MIDHTAYRFRVDGKYLFVSRQNYTKTAIVSLLSLCSQAPLSLSISLPSLPTARPIPTLGGSMSPETMTLPMFSSLRSSYPPSSQNRYDDEHTHPTHTHSLASLCTQLYVVMGTHETGAFIHLADKPSEALFVLDTAECRCTC